MRHESSSTPLRVNYDLQSCDDWDRSYRDRMEKGKSLIGWGEDWSGFEMGTNCCPISLSTRFCNGSVSQLDRHVPPSFSRPLKPRICY